MTTITERPYNLSFSENEIRYVFLVDDPLAAGCEVQVEIHYQPSDLSSDKKIAAVAVSPNPDDGFIFFHIKSYLQSLVTPQMPDPNGGILQPVTEQVKHFYIRYREVTKALPDTAWIDDGVNKRILLMGGVEQIKFRRNNFFANYLTGQPQFLTWQPSGKRIFADQDHYLTFLTTDLLFRFSVTVKTVFTDGTENSSGFVQLLLGSYPKLWRIKAGLRSLGLHLIDPAKTIHYYEISASSNGITIAVPYRFYVDYNVFYDWHDFNYFNSIGGIDSVRLQGEFNWNVGVTADDIEQISDRDNFASAFPTSQFKQANILKRDSYKGDIGYSRTQLERESLNELLVSKAIFENIGGRWVRVLNLVRSQDLGTNKDKKWSFPLEWNYGYTDSVYTPRRVNLGPGVGESAPPPPPPPPPPTCVAVGIPAYSFPDGVVGEPYSYSIQLSGTAPFTLSTSTPTDWMTASINGNTLIFSGTPTQAETNQLIALVVHNCSSDSADISDSIVITEDVVVPVTHDVGILAAHQQEVIGYQCFVSVTASENVLTDVVVSITIHTQYSTYNATFNITAGTKTSSHKVVYNANSGDEQFVSMQITSLSPSSFETQHYVDAE